MSGLQTLSGLPLPISREQWQPGQSVLWGALGHLPARLTKDYVSAVGGCAEFVPLMWLHYGLQNKYMPMCCNHGKK